MSARPVSTEPLLEVELVAYRYHKELLLLMVDGCTNASDVRALIDRDMVPCVRVPYQADGRTYAYAVYLLYLPQGAPAVEETIVLNNAIDAIHAQFCAKL